MILLVFEIWIQTTFSASGLVGSQERLGARSRRDAIGRYLLGSASISGVLRSVSFVRGEKEK